MNELIVDAIKYLCNLYLKGKIDDSKFDFITVINDICYCETKEDVNKIMKEFLIKKED